MRFPGLIAAVAALLFAAPAFAQDAPSAERLALADRFLALSQGDAMEEAIKAQLDEAYGKSELPAAEREWLMTNMTVTITRVMEQALVDLRDDVAALFTEEELRATIAFYETPVGQSVVNKSVEIGIEMEEVMMPHLLEGMTRLGEKYCARFTCDTDEEAVSFGKSRR